MILLWLLVGIAAVAIAFFIPGNSPELWPGLNAAAIPVVVYLLALGFYTLRPPITMRSRIITWVLILVVGVADFSSWTGMDRETHWQHDLLLQIHSMITRGILTARIPITELKTLESYYKQGANKKETLAQTFQRLNNNASVGSNIYKAEYPGDSLSIIVQSMADSQIVLLGLHAYSKGRKPAFTNFNGKVGMVQEKYTLTEKGIAYESEN